MPASCQLADHQREQLHPLRERERSLEVRTERVADADRRLLRAGRLRGGDRRVHRRDLLRLRAVVVAARERVAQLHVHRRQAPLAPHVELRMPAVRALEARLVEVRGGVGDARLRHEALGDLVDARHLRRPLRVGERADRDQLRAGLAERVEQAQLRVDRDVGPLDLQALAHRVVT